MVYWSVQAAVGPGWPTSLRQPVWQVRKPTESDGLLVGPGRGRAPLANKSGPADLAGQKTYRNQEVVFCTCRKPPETVMDRQNLIRWILYMQKTSRNHHGPSESYQVDSG